MPFGFVLIISAVLLLHSQEAYTCSSFSMKSGDLLVFGYNMDWNFGDGRVYVNKRYVAKTAFETISNSGVTIENTATWQAKYGSVGFSLGPSQTLGAGMNEAGLVISVMLLTATGYPQPDARTSIDLAQWVGFQLDNCQSVEEVIASDRNIRINHMDTRYPVHFFVADRKGDTAAIEFLDGKMVHHKNANCLTNDTYAASINHQGTNVNSPHSLERFYRIKTQLPAYTPRSSSEAVANAFTLLNTVSKPVDTHSYPTQWQIVFDQKALQIHFKTKNSPRVKRIDLKKIDFACNTPILMLSIDQPGAGDVTGAFFELENNMYDLYIDFVYAAVKRFGYPQSYEQLKDAIKTYEGRFKCEQ